MNLFESIRYTVQALSGLVFRDQRAFDDGDVIGGLKLFDPNTIIENLTRSPTYALKLNDNKLFHKAIQDWEDCTKVLTKPVFQEACNGDIKAQKFYQDKRSIFYLLKDNSLKGNIFHIKEFIIHIKKTYDCFQRKKEIYSSLQTNIDI